MRVGYQSLLLKDAGIVLTYDENARSGNLRAYDSGGVDAIHVRHKDVHYYYIRSQQFCLFHRLQTVPSLTAYHPTMMRSQQGTQDSPEGLLIINYQYPAQWR
jgi:hypothetical protein